MFRPARDTGGKAVAGGYTLNIRWQLPNDNMPSDDPDKPIAMRVLVDTDGHIVQCQVGLPSPSAPVTEGGPRCDSFARHLVQSITHRMGKPLAQRVEGRFLVDYALGPDLHDVGPWPKDLILLNDMSVSYSVTPERRKVNCKRDVRIWEEGASIPSPCDGQTPDNVPADKASELGPRVDAILRVGYRLLPND